MANSDWMNCALDVKDLVVAVDDDFTSANVRIQKVPWNRPDLSSGGVILSHGQNTRKAATNKKNEIGQAILVTALIPSNQAHDDLTELARLLSWRESLRNALIGQTLETGGAFDTMVVPGTVVVAGAFQNMYDATQLTVICKTR